VAQAFRIGPYQAHQELGGGVLARGRRRRLTLDCADAMHADRLVSDHKGAKGEGSTDHWSDSDMMFFHQLRTLGGFE